MMTSKKRVCQHVSAGNHQSNGASHCRSSRPVTPTPYDALSIRDMAIKALSQALAFREAAYDVIGGDAAMQQPVQPLPVQPILCQFNFGWAKRSQVKAPPLHPRVQEFVQWCWKRGEEGHTKIDPGTVIELMLRFGKEDGMNEYPQNDYWQAAYHDSEGVGIFTDDDLPEASKIKQLYGKIGGAKKEMTKLVAQTGHLSHAQKREELGKRLRDEAILDTLLTSSDGILDSLVEFVATTIEQSEKQKMQYGNFKQMHLKPWLVRNDLSISITIKRAVVTAIGLVGTAAPYTRLGSVEEGGSAEVGNDDDDEDDDEGIDEHVNVEQFTGSISELCVAIVNEIDDECDDDDNDMNEE
jgi:hypothetical protein